MLGKRGGAYLISEILGVIKHGIPKGLTVNGDILIRVYLLRQIIWNFCIFSGVIILQNKQIIKGRNLNK